MNNLDYFKNVEKDLKAYVDQSILRVTEKDTQTKNWLKSLPLDDLAKILVGYSRPHKWGLQHVVEFFECRAKKTDTLEAIFQAKTLSDFESIGHKLDGAYGAHSFFNFLTLEELEQKFNNFYSFKSFEEYLNFVKKDSDEYAQRNPEADNAVTGEFVVEYYAKLRERLQTSHLLVFGLNSVTPRNFSSKMPYCYEVNVLVIPQDIIVPQELLRDAIDYRFIAEANIANLVQVFYADQNEDDDF